MPSYRIAQQVGGRGGRVRHGHGRRRLGRQLVLPGATITARRLALENVERLTDFAWRIRQALERDGITGDDGGEIDHIELFGPPLPTGADSRNFVLCPGKAYDRSPCGTGTSAKLACLAADGKLRRGEIWRQESIVGSVFEGSLPLGGRPRSFPSITGSAYVNAEATLILDPRDPFSHGNPR